MSSDESSCCLCYISPGMMEIMKHTMSSDVSLASLDRDNEEDASDSKKRTNEVDNVSTKQPPMKMPRFEGEPDVIVAVGGKEFEEYSHNLRCWFGYFEDALRSDTERRRFEFPNKNAEEWKLLQSVLDPSPDKKITKDNVYTLLPFFDELCCARGLETCDRILCEKLESSRIPSDAEDILKLVSECNRCNREQPKKKGMAKLKELFLLGPMCMRKQVPKILAYLLKADLTCRNDLWGALKNYLPPSAHRFQEDIVRELINSPLLVDYMDMKAKMHEKEEALGGVLRHLRANEKGQTVHVPRQKMSYSSS